MGRVLLSLSQTLLSPDLSLSESQFELNRVQAGLRVSLGGGCGKSDGG